MDELENLPNIRNTIVLLLLTSVVGGCIDVKKKQAPIIDKQVQAFAIKKDSIPIDSLQTDSSQLALMVNRTLDIAIKDFERKVDTSFNDWNYAWGGTSVHFTTGHFFNKQKQYLLLERTLGADIYINIYEFETNGFKELLHYEEDKIVYQRDTIMDTNGDGLNDFCIVIYSSSGCCRRNVFQVYLAKENGLFAKDIYEFINPTFYPKEKLIRGVEYGHPGEVCLYKYKWNGFKIDTIESVCPDLKNKGKFFINKWTKSRAPTDISSSLPAEYMSVTDLDWFLDY